MKLDLKPMFDLKNKNILVTGASRGIGRKIALICASHGAKIGLLARSDISPSHEKLEGTLKDVSSEIEKMGGKSLILPCNLQNSREIVDAVDKMQQNFGGIDALVNNASVLSIEKIPSIKKNELMFGVNTLGTANLISTCHEALKKSSMGHVLSLSPPLRTLSRKWMHPHPVYTASKYGMSMVTIGYADTLRANTIWPQKLLRTSATKMMEQTTGLPAYTQGLDPTKFAHIATKIIRTDSSGLSCLDSEIEPISEQGIDDIFI